MLSYRHSYHAGNHADVLKHLCQMLLIEKLKSKDKGFYYFDTHSGAGLYQLDSTEAQKTNEFVHGIARLEKYVSHNPLLKDYLSLVAQYHQFNQYPGSPEIAKRLLRKQDKMVLMEWHNQEVNQLKSNIGGTNIAIHHRDGYEGLKALTPPSLPRGLVLIDPPYETSDEYQQVVSTVKEVHKKWPTAMIAIWYPLLSKREKDASSFTSSHSKKGQSEAMLMQLSQQSFKNLLNVELCVTNPAHYQGMYGSGVAIINAPWQFDQQIESCLSELTPVLAQDKHASYATNWLIQAQ